MARHCLTGAFLVDGALQTVDDLALTQADCAWALAHMSTEEGEQIVNELRRRDVGSTVTQLLYRYSSPLLLAPLLRILGNIVASSAFELPSMESMRDDEAGEEAMCVHYQCFAKKSGIECREESNRVQGKTTLHTISHFTVDGLQQVGSPAWA